MNVRDDGGGVMLWDATPRHSIAIALEISEAVATRQSLQNISPFTLHYFRQKLRTMLICEHTLKYLAQKLIGVSHPFSKQGWWS